MVNQGADARRDARGSVPKTRARLGVIGNIVCGNETLNPQFDAILGHCSQNTGVTSFATKSIISGISQLVQLVLDNNAFRFAVLFDLHIDTCNVNTIIGVSE